MLFNFAIQPDCLVDKECLRIINLTFGISEGRLVSQFPKRFLGQIYDLGRKKYSGTQYSQFEILLNEIKTKLIRSGLDFDGSLGWLENAENLEEEFKAILSTENPRSHPKIIVSDDRFEKNDLFKVKTEGSIPRIEEEICKNVSPLIDISNHIVLVDQNFDPSKDRFVDVLRELILFSQKEEKRKRVWEYHLNFETYEKPFSDFKNQCEGIILPLLLTGSEFSFFRWEEITRNDEFHPRYILTEKGGMDINVGLDKGPPGTTTDIRLLSEDLYEERWKDYQIGSSPFKFVDKVIIHGNQ